MAKENAYQFLTENPDQLNLAEPEDVVYQNFYSTMDAGIVGEKENITALINAVYQARAILGLEVMDDYSNLRIRNPKSTYTSKSLRANIFYPNPARDEIFINYIGVNDCAVEIYDMTGRLIFKQTLPDKKISVKSLSPGSYIFKLIIGKKILAEELINVIK
ncbi:MAG: T9SS type A sorting domain-containing protein [Bacteroidetes bacterium]|nr:T9SS type A sorting domain-containing protein [Bacteroidota bacterium]